MSSARLASALELIANGVKVLRLMPGTKKPYPGSRGFKDATDDEATVRSWFEHEDPNIGFRPWDAHMVVIDLDTYHEHDAFLASQVRECANYIVQARGLHCYFRTDLPYANGTLGKGIDVRGANGYVLAPGSVVDDVEYKVILDGEPSQLPTWVGDRINEAKPAREPIPQEDLEGLDKEVNIQRAADYLFGAWPEHEPGYHIACTLLDCGLSPDKATELFDHWSHGLEWSWDPDDIASKVEHAWLYRQNRGSSPLALDDTPPEEKYAEIIAEAQAQAEKVRERFAMVKPSEGPGLAEIKFWDKNKTLPVGQLIVRYGEWGSFKTTMSLADWLRTSARVVYAAGEGSHGVLKLRIPAQAAALGISLEDLDERWRVVRAVPLLTDKAEVEAFAAAIEGFAPDVVIIDTLATATAGSDENTAVWSALMTDNGAVGWLRRKFGTMEVIAHSGKDVSRGVRGHSGALANADAGLQCVRQGEHVKVFVEKMRDGEDKKDFWWKIEKAGNGVPVPVPSAKPTPEPDDRYNELWEAIKKKEAHDWDRGLRHEMMAQVILGEGATADQLAEETALLLKDAKKYPGLIEYHAAMKPGHRHRWVAPKDDER